MDTDRNDKEKGGREGRRQHFPALVPACLALAGVIHGAWLLWLQSQNRGGWNPEWPRSWELRWPKPSSPSPSCFVFLSAGTREWGPGRSE